MDNKDIFIDNIKLDLNNKKFFDAADIVLNSDVPVIYLTGKAGTGKSIFVKYIKAIYEKSLVILAPTGVAAVNVKGQTIHSFFPIDFSVYSPDDDRLSDKKIASSIKLTKNKIDLIKNLDLIIIDEISMVRSDVLDCVDRILKFYRKSDKPFGGVKMLLVGDTFQLPPVVINQEKQILNKFYSSEFFFDSNAYKNSSPFYIQLDKVYRQEEKLFLSILEKIRIGEATSCDLEILNENSSQKSNEGTIMLTSKKYEAESYNSLMLNDIKRELYTYQADQDGIFPDPLKPVDTILELKIGAQVMIMKNKFSKDGLPTYYNGQIGIISELNNDNISINCGGKSISVEKAEWENNRYIWDEELKRCKIELLGTFRQYPLKLAWAITIHKSQGLTFDNVNINLSNWVANGGTYVALSRCRTLSGIHLVRPLTEADIKVDKVVLDFAKNETPNALIINKIEEGKATRLYCECQSYFEFNEPEKMFETFKKASKIRDIMDTNTFFKFIKIKLSLYHRYKQKNLLLSIEKNKLYSELEQLKECLYQRESEVKVLNDSIYDLNNYCNVIEEKNRDIQYKSEQLNIELERQVYENSYLKNKLDIQHKSFCKLKGDKIEISNINVSLVQEVENLKKELRRVKDITLWQRILGKK